MFFFLFFAASLFTFTSCGDDDDDCYECENAADTESFDVCDDTNTLTIDGVEFDRPDGVSLSQYVLSFEASGYDCEKK